MYLVRNIDEATNPIPQRKTFDQVGDFENPQHEQYKNLIGFRRK
jgi:hypothetical protein